MLREMFCMIAPSIIPGVLTAPPGSLKGLSSTTEVVLPRPNDWSRSEGEDNLHQSTAHRTVHMVTNLEQAKHQTETSMSANYERRSRASERVISVQPAFKSFAEPNLSANALLHKNPSDERRDSVHSTAFKASLGTVQTLTSISCCRHPQYHKATAEEKKSYSHSSHTSSYLSDNNVKTNSDNSRISKLERIAPSDVAAVPSNCRCPVQEKLHSRKFDSINHSPCSKKIKRGLSVTSCCSDKSTNALLNVNQKTRTHCGRVHSKTSTPTSQVVFSQNRNCKQKQANHKECETVSSRNNKPQSFSDVYNVEGIIGVGGGGMVYAGSRTSDKQPVAIKRIMREKVKRWERVQGRTVPQEIALMIKVNGHKGIIRLLDWYECLDSFILIMERPQNSIDLFDYIREVGRMKEKEACMIFKQIVSAVYYIHLRGVVHRDIKDENIVLNRDTGESKIIDFGCGTYLHDRPYTDFSGTPEFYPPEWFNEHYYCGRTATVWSLGVLLFDMLCGEIPFKSKGKISQGKYEFKANISNEAKHLINWMLSTKPEGRPTLANIVQHPWVNGKNL